MLFIRQQLYSDYLPLTSITKKDQAIKFSRVNEAQFGGKNTVHLHPWAYGFIYTHKLIGVDEQNTESQRSCVG